MNYSLSIITLFSLLFATAGYSKVKHCTNKLLKDNRVFDLLVDTVKFDVDNKIFSELYKKEINFDPEDIDVTAKLQLDDEQNKIFMHFSFRNKDKKRFKLQGYYRPSTKKSGGYYRCGVFLDVKIVEVVKKNKVTCKVSIERFNNRFKTNASIFMRIYNLSDKKQVFRTQMATMKFITIKRTYDLK